MRARPGFDPASLVSGVIVIVLGLVLLLDQAEVVDVHWNYMLPLVLGAAGGILLACGLTGPRRRG